MLKQNKNKKFVIGVTGIFGSGKSTVSAMLKSYGLKIIDADKIARRYLFPGTKTYKKILNYFGKGILKKNNKIDRKKLGELVFGNRQLLNKLNSIVHPKVIADIKEGIRKSKEKVVVLDAPLLIESGLRRVVDDLIVVIIERDELMRRLARRATLKRQEILKRIKSQIPQKVKSRLANFIIDNSGTINETKKQVKKMMEKIEEGMWRN
ncbi:MAG: dephospho-CoA kinase [Candidatus Omnitrophota bacterium]|jgi:dephospho-CoA kinase